MDVQLKKGLIDVCVLAVLNRGDSYGYQIIKDISPYMEVSESTLYPILKRLDNGKFLTVYSREHSGRLRKYYQITEKGQERIRIFKKEWDEVMTVYHFIVSEGGDAAHEKE